MHQNQDNQEQEVHRIDKMIAVRNEKIRDRQSQCNWVHEDPKYKVEGLELVLPTVLVVFGCDAGIDDDTES